MSYTSLFGAAQLTVNADCDKYGHNGYGIGFDACSQFSLANGEWGKNVVIFGADSSSAACADNKKQDILVFGEGPTERLDDTTTATETKLYITITKSNILLILPNQKRKFVKVCITMKVTIFGS